MSTKPFAEWTDAELADYLEANDPGRRRAPRDSWKAWVGAWGATRVDAPGPNGDRVFVRRELGAQPEQYGVLHMPPGGTQYGHIPVDGMVRAAVVAGLLWLGLPIPD